MIRNFMKALCLLAALCCTLPGQNTAGTGSISGVITDPTGSAVPGASVLVENQSKGIRRELRTTEGGLFSAPSLVPAAGYQLTVNASGFAPYQVTNISVAVGQNVNLTPKLAVNTSTTTVEVTTEAPIVDSTRS